METSINGAVDVSMGLGAAPPGETLQRLNRELRAISNCNQVLVRAGDETGLLKDICRIVCDEAGYRMAWVGYAEHDADRRVRPVAHGGADAGFIAEAGITWSETVGGEGPAGRAIRTGCTVCTQDIEKDLSMRPWREQAIRRGYRSVITLPLKNHDGAVLGVFEIYASESNAFTPAEIRLMEELAADLAFGIAALRARTEREQAQEALRVGEERYRTLFENSPVSIREEDFSALRVLLDDLTTTGTADHPVHLEQHPEIVREWASRTNIIDLNRAALRLLGANSKEELRAGLAATITPQWIATMQRALIGFSHGATALSDESVINTLSGEPRYVTVYFSVCPGHESNLSRIFVSHVDITNRKRIENTQRFIAQLGWSDASDSFLTSLASYLAETLDVEYVVIDRLAEPPGVAETVALYAKGGIVPNLRYSLKGTPCDNVMGKRLCYYPKQVQSLFPADSLLVEMGVESYAGIPLWDASGKGIGLIAVMDSKPLCDEEAVTQILQLVAVSAAAFLEREQSDILLRQREQQFRNLADNIPDLIVSYDSSLCRTFVNHAWEQATGLSAAEVLHVPAAHLHSVPPQVADEFTSKIARVLQNGVTEKIEFSWRNVRDETLFLEYLIVPEYDHEGKIVGVLSVGRDITERKQAEHALLELNSDLEVRVKKRTAELEKKNQELARMNQLFVGRELRMVELKQRILELEKKNEAADASRDREAQEARE